MVDLVTGGGQDTGPVPAGLLESLASVVGPQALTTGSAISPDDTTDEGLTSRPVTPWAVVRPSTTEQVAAVMALAERARVPVVARGSGTGLSGAAVPVAGGLVVAFDAMDRILEVDTDNHVAVVQPGVTLSQLDQALAPLGLLYPVSPGEPSASIGGNVGTNAGGMRAIRYGVTRHHVLGLELVLADGRVLRTGGKVVKSATGYDLTQLVVGSEGTLALVTEITLKLEPRPTETATLLAPFPTLEQVSRAVGPLVASGVGPVILEYLDALTMAGITRAAEIDLGSAAPAGQADAYLVVVLQGTDARRLEEDMAEAAERLGAAGALDVYVLPPHAGSALIAARERAFYVAKAAGADDIVDAVVPRAAVAPYLEAVAALAAEAGALMTGCGHVGDGNVHLSVFLPDPERRAELLHRVMAQAVALGGAVSGEHGIGTAKRASLAAFADPTALELMRAVKAAFDPHGILGPGRIFGPDPDGGPPGRLPELVEGARR